MCSGFSTLRMIYLINEDITRAKTFYLVYLSFLLSSCSLSLSFVGLQGQKSQAFGSAGAIQLPVCHNAGSTRCGNCQLMAVYPPQKLASQCLPKLRTCQPMIVEPCTSQTMPAKSQDAVSFCSTENWWISESFGWMENSQLNFREKKKVLHVVPLSVSSD